MEVKCLTNHDSVLQRTLFVENAQRKDITHSTVFTYAEIVVAKELHVTIQRTVLQET